MITPVPTHTPPLNKVTQLIGDVWSQWMNGLRAAVNQTPGNSIPTTFANLPTAATTPKPTIGTLTVVTDATVNTWGTAIVIGGGGFTVTAHFNGTNWTVAAI